MPGYLHIFGYIEGTAWISVEFIVASAAAQAHLSDVVILYAQDFAGEPIATIRLPVPAQSRGDARRLSVVRTPRSPKSVRWRLGAGASLWTGALLRQRIP